MLPDRLWSTSILPTAYTSVLNAVCSSLLDLIFFLNTSINNCFHCKFQSVISILLLVLAKPFLGHRLAGRHFSVQQSGLGTMYVKFNFLQE